MKSAIKSSSIVIIDFGSQVCHLIAKRLRELGVYSIIKPFNISLNEFQTLHPRGLILSGGPASIYAPDAPQLSFDLKQLDIPILGICYGHQLLAQQYGGRVSKTDKREFGVELLKIEKKALIFDGWDVSEPVLMSHADQVTQLPEGFFCLAKTEL
jgi:GMP synthase (glutamine-hydrolysing)